MAPSPALLGRPSKGRLTLVAFLVCFSLFALNVLLGKAVIAFGWEGVPLLSDTAEFLLLLFAVTMFVIAALQREQAQARAPRTDTHDASKPREE